MDQPDERAKLAASVAESVSRLNSLLRGEIAAAETYRVAIDKAAGLGQADAAAALRKIQEEHGRAAQAIRERVQALGGDASDTSGIWGLWARTVQEASALLGDVAGLRALAEGEAHGLKEYESALEAVDANTADLIRNRFLIAQERHIQSLGQLVERGGAEK